MIDSLRWSKFDWDEHNTEKIWVKHHVPIEETEQIFFNKPIFLKEDEEHSQHERRFHALGRTDEDKLLFVAFTIRGDLIRVISARPMSRKERKTYVSNQKEDSSL